MKNKRIYFFNNKREITHTDENKINSTFLQNLKHHTNNLILEE